MKYSRKVARPEFADLEAFFNQRFEKYEIQNSALKYKSTIRLKINLRCEMNIELPAQIELVNEGVLTRIEITVNSKKIILGSFLMFGLITIISYLISSSIFALLFGLNSGLFVYYISRNQVQRELENYLKNLLKNT